MAITGAPELLIVMGASATQEQVDEVGSVEEDVRGHQDGVLEEPGRDELMLLRLLLELGHAAELAEARDRIEQPTPLGVRVDVALDEDRRAVRVEPGRKQHRGQRERRFAQVVGVVFGRDRVQVDDAEERLALVLRRDVLPVAARVVPERLVAGGSDAGEDAGLVGHGG